MSRIEQKKQPVRLWIHVQREDQGDLGEEIFKAIADTSIMGRRVERKPLQVVDFGPRESQLRYFKKEDEAEATELFSILRSLISQLTLNNLSSEYDHVRWIKTGHFELWLSPALVLIEPPQ